MSKFTELSTMAKRAIGAGVITSAVLITGITFQGESAIENIKTNLTEMTAEFNEVIADNDFLQTQFNTLTEIYSGSVLTANERINSLVAERDTLLNQIAHLETTIPNDDDMKAEAETLQAEINRLESELNKANELIFELETYAQGVAESINYKPIDQSQYTATAQDVAQIPVPIRESARNLDLAKAERMADMELVAEIESRLATKAPKDITAVTTVVVDGIQVLAYEVTEYETYPNNLQIADTLSRLLEKNIGNKTYFVTPAGDYNYIYNTYMRNQK